MDRKEPVPGLELVTWAPLFKLRLGIELLQTHPQSSSLVQTISHRVLEPAHFPSNRSIMAKEKNFNPVQDHKKAEKQKQLRKQKATVQAQRNEKLARRNPARIQRDIDSLKEAEQSGGSLRPHERQRLAELEKDLVAVNRARTALGDKAPQFKPERNYDNDDRGDRGGRGGRGGGVLGKRTRDGDWKGRDGNESSDTDADVKDIPMPRDTPPPLPRRPNRHTQAEEPRPEPKKATLVYEAAPQVRDLRKEAVKFMPASVAQKMKLAKGEGRLLEPEEFDKLQKEGYINVEKSDNGGNVVESAGPVGVGRPPNLLDVKPLDPIVDKELEEFMRQQTVEEIAEKAAEAAVQEAQYNMMAVEAGGKIQDLGPEGKVAERKLRQVEIEEVEDEDL